MAGGAVIKNKQEGQPIKVGQSNPVEQSKEKAKLKLLKVHIFFDGTRNNIHNTKSGRENPKHKDRDVSYQNYYSNVALLFMACEENETQKKIYVEGAGTRRGKKDDSFGLGMAMGPSSLGMRVDFALRELYKAIENNPNQGVLVNVFGFSRGSFYARYFCYLLNKRKPSVQINFLGLYDTVSSEGGKHYNDIKAFNLNIGAAQKITRIVHITSQNDYRYHFPLTRVNTAVDNKIAFECSMPGAHSDIGGGYSETSTEQCRLSAFDLNNRPTDDEISWRWFRAMGYYKGNPVIKAKYQLVPSEDLTLRWDALGYCHIFAKRATTYDYQFISLEIMRDIAKKYTGLQFNHKDGKPTNDGIASMKKIPVLSKFSNYAYKHIVDNCHKNDLNYVVKISESGLSDSEIMSIYGKYIHNSLQPGDIANQGGDGTKGRYNKVLVNGKPDYMQPKRIIISDLTSKLE